PRQSRISAAEGQHSHKQPARVDYAERLTRLPRGPALGLNLSYSRLATTRRSTNSMKQDFAPRNGRLWHKADASTCLLSVRFRGKSYKCRRVARLLPPHLSLSGHWCG